MGDLTFNKKPGIPGNHNYKLTSFACTLRDDKHDKQWVDFVVLNNIKPLGSDILTMISTKSTKVILGKSNIF